MCTFCEKIYPNKDCYDIVFGRGKYSKMKYDEIERFITIDEDGTYDLNVIPDDPYEMAFFPDVKFCPYCGRNLAENAEQEPCDDVVSRQDVLKTMCEFCPVYNCTSKCSSYEHMTLLPSVRPQEQTGHWIKIVVNGQHKIKCDKCDYIEPEYVTHIRNYCPNCGVKMVDPQESEEAEA